MSPERQGHRKEESCYSKDGQWRARPEHTLQARGIIAGQTGACTGSLHSAALPAAGEEARFALLLATLETFTLTVLCLGSARRASPGCERRLKTPQWGSSWLINEKNNVFWWYMPESCSPLPGPTASPSFAAIIGY